MVFYFAYGSNMDEFQMRERCPTARLRFVARLRNHELCFPRCSSGRHGGVSSVRPARRRVVWGVVYALTDTDLDKLNSCEGYHTDRDAAENSYNPVEMEVEKPNGKKHRCIVYIATLQEPGNFLPSLEGYLNYIIRSAEQHQHQHQHQHHGIPKSYVRKLRKITTSDD
jgi:cation transport regulator ChaC